MPGTESADKGDEEPVDWCGRNLEGRPTSTESLCICGIAVVRGPSGTQGTYVRCYEVRRRLKRKRSSVSTPSLSTSFTVPVL